MTDVLLVEPGGRWRSVLWGPVLCAVGVGLELVTDSPVHWFAFGAAAVLLAGVSALGVRAARTHTSVLLTPTALHQGTQVLELGTVAAVLPEPDAELAPALGESPVVPRGRDGVGLRLTDGRVVQAWARDAPALRAALQGALEHPQG